MRTEGLAMLSAVMEDFSRLPGLEVCGIVDESREFGIGSQKSGIRSQGSGTELTSDSCFLTSSGQFHSAGKQFRRIRPPEEEAVFRQLAGQADYTLVIAPEFDDILARRCRWVEEVHGRLLGPSSAAARLTGDKLALGQRLQDYRIPTPHFEVFAAGKFRPSFPFPVVCKPRFGAGSLATFLVRDAKELARCQDQLQAEGWQGEMLVQPFVPGQATSVAFLISPRQRLTLLPAAQNLSADGRFRYLGGTLPLRPELAKRAVCLASGAIEAVPGLRGYVGVDLVLGGNEDGSGDGLIEINPRLTASYIGLRALCKANLAEAMLRLAAGEIMPALNWRPGVVHFQPDGTILGIADSGSGLGFQS
jgi:predicted ATP-grasp superfamily ATP-dependent carboligase